jgi:hypothetical protein
VLLLLLLLLLLLHLDNYQFFSPTDAQLSSLKNSFEICIKIEPFNVNFNVSFKIVFLRLLNCASVGGEKL